MKIKFQKYQGTGNDFVILDNRTNEFSNLTTAQIKKLCDRRFGVGGDFSKGKQVDFVLGEFDSGDAAELPIFIDKSCDAILSFCTIGMERTMNTVNAK